MTIAVYLLGALAAAAGTRLAAAGFIAAAVLAALDGGPFAAAATWTAALAAGLVLLERRSIRHLALPALGSAAVLAAALASNGAVVGGLWVMGTACAILTATDGRRDAEPAMRWALGLCLLDVPVVAAIAAASTRGFEGWPLTIEWWGAILLLASAVMRAPLAAGDRSDLSPAGLMIVRTQALVLVTLAILAGGSGIATAAVLIGAATFAAVTLSPRREILDAVQEISLYAIAAGATELGWTTQGWVWGALAAGTLIHHLRLMVGRRTAGQWADATLKSAGIGLPFLPVVVALLQGALGVRGWTAVALGLGLAAGLAGRTRSAARPARRGSKPAGPPILEDLRGAPLVAMAVVASMWAGALSLPAPPAGSAIGWPPAWAVAAVFAAGIAGAWVHGVVPARRAATPAATVDIPAWLRLPALPGSARATWGAFAVLALAAAAMWMVGLTRGFL